MVREYASSIVWFVVGIFILFWQFILPDPIPDLVMGLIKQDNSIFVGLDFTLKAFLLLYTISGFASFIAGIATAVFTYKRSH